MHAADQGQTEIDVQKLKDKSFRGDELTIDAIAADLLYLSKRCASGRLRDFFAISESESWIPEFSQP